MSASAQKAVLQEALDLSHQFRENSAMRNGIPTRPPRNVISDEPPAPPIVKLMRKKPAGKPLAEPLKEIITQQVVTRVPGWIKGAALTSLVGLGGLGGVVAATLAGREGQDGRDGRDAAPPAATDNGGDLLYWLKREGYDLPPRAEAAP